MDHLNSLPVHSDYATLLEPREVTVTVEVFDGETKPRYRSEKVTRKFDRLSYKGVPYLDTTGLFFHLIGQDVIREASRAKQPDSRIGFTQKHRDSAEQRLRDVIGKK